MDQARSAGADDPRGDGGAELSGQRREADRRLRQCSGARAALSTEAGCAETALGRRRCQVLRPATVVALVAAVAAGCSSAGGDYRAVDLEVEKAALIRIDTEFSKMAQERGLAEAFATYAAPDATMMPMNQNPVLGRELIRGQFADTPQETKLLWKP